MDDRRLFVLWRSTVEVVNQKTTLIAATCAAFAVMQQISGRTIFPTWIWWAAALALLFVSSVLLRRQLIVERQQLIAEREQRKTPEPTLDLSSAIAKILGTEDPAILGSSTALSQVVTEIREKASLGQLSVWGRKNAKASRLSFYPLEPIPSSHWSSTHIDFLEFSKDPKCATQNARHPGSPDQYSDLHFDLEEISDRWKLGEAEAR
jgi:hypothetical protein